MKNIYFLGLILLVSSVLFSCNKDGQKTKDKSVDLMTAQTLGLAYLEEYKLEEAEKEFLKVIELSPKDKMGYANLGLVYLRSGKYNDAESQLFKAIEIDSTDADVRLLLATIYQMDDKRPLAISVLTETLKWAPDHVKILYDLSELYSTESTEESQIQRKKYLEILADKAPGNLVPHLNLTEIYIKDGSTDKAIEQLEIIQKQFPEIPDEAKTFFDKSKSALGKSDLEPALVNFMIFHNYMKVTFPYQSGILDLKGPGGSLIGFPLITYDLESSSHGIETESLLEIIRFVDVTASVGLDKVVLNSTNDNPKSQYSTHISIADFNGDGISDIYAGSFDAEKNSYRSYLFNNDVERFWNVSKEVGIDHNTQEKSAQFADFDNDGYLDLYIVKEEADILYRNAGKGQFKDISTQSQLTETNLGNKALAVDLDHDGDLDIFKSNNGINQVFRNNGDGTFVEKAVEMGLSGKQWNTIETAFGDFDDDGDLDLISINENSENILYDNQRQGKFKNLTQKRGLKNIKNSSSVSVADYNNDGFLDLLITSTHGASSMLYRNSGTGSFNQVKSSKDLFKNLNQVKVLDSKFFDFDNDGFLDIIVVGEPKNENDRGLFLYHNEGENIFNDVSHLLPDHPKSGNQIELFDYNGDGDLDIVVAGLNGGVSLIRNDGGSINHYMNLKLVGLRTGSAKNNYFGIGAKVEMRSGDLYQTTVVTNPNLYFGLGNKTKADIIRITWTNGVPQNIFLPDADQALIESQVLKGSCPFIYTWNGTEYEFVKDITWRSALGMPLGIMGGTTMHAFANASDDYIKIPGEMLEPIDGKYAIQLTSELWETIYMDKIELVVLDHPATTEIYIPEQFSPPPFPGMDLYQIEKKNLPVSAIDENGNDVLPLLSKKDHKYLSDFELGKYQGITEMHDLILDPGDAGNSKDLYLFLNGWIFPTDASINVALSQNSSLNAQSPFLQVINEKGEWQTVIEQLGFPMGKDKTVIADLSDKFLSSDHRIRIRTNMEVYWDEVFFATEKLNTNITTTVLDPHSADLHYRGFSKTYRKGGRYGPHWFDYKTVEKNTKWRDLTGNYTRYGDVRSLLLQPDNQYIISNAGDETTLKFDTKDLPLLKEGYKRTFMIHSVGWVKDGDINTAFGNTVEPLPYHGMSSYPPSEKDIYPDSEELKAYHKKYNTRKVNMDKYRDAIKNHNEE